MYDKRTVTLGHAATFAFATVLLAASQKFLILHPLIAALLLAAFSPVYLLAARFLGKRYFLYPFLILLLLSYHLFLFGLGLNPAYLIAFSLVPLFGIDFAGRRNLYGTIDQASRVGVHVNALLIAVITSIVAFRYSFFWNQFPDITCLTFLGFSAHFVLRYLDEKKPLPLAFAVLFGFIGYAILLSHHSNVALVLVALMIGFFAFQLRFRRMLVPEGLFYAVTLLLLAYQLFVGNHDWKMILGFSGMGLVTLAFAMYLHRPGQMKSLFPLFAGGTLMMLVPIYLLFPYSNPILLFVYLAITIAAFGDIGRDLKAASRTFLGMIASRILGFLARSVCFAAFFILAWKHFPASYQLAILSLAMAYLTIVAGFRNTPAILKRRNVYFYFAGIFLSIAHILFIRRFGFFDFQFTLLVSTPLLLVIIFAAAERFRSRLTDSQFLTIMDVGTVVALGACVYQGLFGTVLMFSATLSLLIGIVAAVAFLKRRPVAAINVIPVALGLLLYSISQRFGLQGETLGIPFFAFGLLFAIYGARDEKRGTSWFSVAYLGWILFFAVSSMLFYPYRGLGAYLTPLWVPAFLIVAKLKLTRPRPVFSFLLELAGHAFAFVCLFYLVFIHQFTPASVAAFVYAALYAYLSARTRQLWYFYPTNLLLAAGMFLIVLNAGELRFYLIYSIPLAMFYSALLVYLQKQDLPKWDWPVHAAATLNAAVGAFLMLFLLPNESATVGMVAGLAYFMIYAALVHIQREKAFLSGVALAFSFVVFYALWKIPQVTPANHLALFAPLSLILFWVGKTRNDQRSNWALYSAAIAIALVSEVFSFSPELTFSGMSRLILFVSMTLWLLLLVWARSEIFVYLSSLTLASLAYNFLQSTTDRFGQHMFIFFLYGVGVLGLIFVARIVRNFVRFRKPVLLVEGKKWSAHFLYITPIVVIVVATLGGFTIESTSNPLFCGTCHSMNRYYANWQTSTHGKTQVSCSSCHYEPGLSGYMKAKVRGFSELVTEATDTGSYKPQAIVKDSSCLRAGCHDVSKLTAVTNRHFSFDHSIHLGVEIEGIQLHCTSCHSKADTNTHFTVDTQACFSCHFASHQIASQDCTACHEVPQQAVGNLRFRHASLVSSTENQCLMCHSGGIQTVSGSSLAKCSDCHAEPAASLKADDPVALHKTHVTERNMKCSNCHVSVAHGKKDHPVTMQGDCSRCHESHSEPALIYAGVGGVGVATAPSPMYLSGVECSACHQRGIHQQMKVEETKASCQTCHANELVEKALGGQRELNQDMAEVESLLARVEAAGAGIAPDRSVQFHELVENSRKNLMLVKNGNGIHNICYASQLIAKSREYLRSAEALLPNVRTAQLTGRM